MEGYKKNIIKFYIFTSCMFFYLWLPIWMIFFQNQGLSLSSIGFLDALTAVLVALLEIPSGAIADKYGRKYSLAFGALIYGLGMFGVVFEIMSPVFLIGYVIWHLSSSFISGTNMAFLYDTLAEVGEEKQYKKIIGRFRAVIQGSVAIGGVLGGWIASYNTTYSFILTGTMGLIAFIIALTFREPIIMKESLGTSIKKAKYFEIIKIATKISFSNAQVRYLILINTVFSAVYFLTVQIFLQPYASEVGFPVASLGLVLLLIQTAGVIGSMLTHRIKKISDFTQIILVLLVFAITQIFLGIIHSPVAIFLFIMIALSNSIIVPTLTALLNDIIPSEQRATILSLQSLVWTLVVAVGEVILLRYAEVINVSFSLYMLSVFLIITMLPLLYLWKRSYVKKELKTLELDSTV